MKPKIEYARKTLFFIIITAALLAGACTLFPRPGQSPDSAFSPEKQQQVQKKNWPHKQSGLSPDPELIHGVLDNGFRYVLMQNTKPEGRVRMHLSADAGSFHETENERGIAHFLEHMLFAGTRHFPPGELVNYFQRIGMKFGPDVNGSTGFFNTTYDLDLPGADEDTLAEGLLVMHDFASEALLEPEEIARESSVILAEKRTRDNPDYRTFKETFRFELPGTRISNRMPIGTEEVIKNADHDLLKNFYHTWYRPERLTLVAVGDFHPQIAENLIKQRFSDLVPRLSEKSDPVFEDFSHNGIKPFYHHEPEAGSTRVAIEVMTRMDQPPDNADYQKNKLLSEMANQIVRHRLDRMRNEPGAPFTRADIYSGHFFKSVKAAEISAHCAPRDWQKSLAFIEQAMRNALKHGFTASEVRRVQKEFATELKQAVKTAATRENAQIARQILYHLKTGRVFQSPKQRLALLGPVVENATAGLLHEVFTDDWAPSHRLVMVTGNADLTEDPDAAEDQIARAYEKSRMTAVEKPAGRGEIIFPYLAAPAEKSRIKTRREIEDLGITRVEFANGVTLLVKKTDFTDNQMLASMSLGHGKSVEPADLPALSEMAAKVINSSGLGELTEDELSQALAGSNTYATFDVEEDKFVFGAQSVPDEIRLMFGLLYAHIEDPGFRQSALDQGANELRQKHQALSHSVQGALALHGQRFLAGGDSRFGFPGIEAIEKIQLEDVRRWLKPAFENAPIEIAVVGDMDPDAVINEAAALFGSLPERKEVRKPAPDQQPKFPEGGHLDISVPTKISKALLVSAYPTTHIWDIHKTRRISVLSDIISDRLRIRIRQDLGASYSQGAYHYPSRGYKNFGLLAGYAIIAPDEINIVEQAVAEIAADLNEKGTTEDELKRAIEPTLTGLREQVKTNDYWLNTVLKGAKRHPEQLQWSRTMEDDYKEITVEEINQAARQWLIPKKAAVLRILPEAADAGK